MTARWWMRGAAALSLGALLVVHPATATADVRVDSTVPRGGGVVDLVLSVSGGCGGSPTIAVVTTTPEGSAVVAVEDPSGWGHTIEGADITWRGPAIAASDPARLVVTARVDALPGDTVVLPTRQVCADGAERAWTGAAGSPSPAPRFVATSATVDPSARPALPEPTTAGAGPLGVAVAVVGFVGLTIAIAAARRRHLRTRGRR